MLSDQTIDSILNHIPGLTVGVLGDIFLDRYLEIDGALTESSIETGLDAYQVVRVRAQPGAAGTVINNLVALGASRVVAFSVVGDDGEGYELRRALAEYKVVDCDAIFSDPGRRTPTYTKPMLHTACESPRELNRLDIKNRSPLSAEMERALVDALDSAWPSLDALLVLDQTGFGVITDPIVARLAELGESDPDRPILADSRERIGNFRSVWAKPNLSECERAVGETGAEASATALAQRTNRPVFCTCGERGVVVADPRDGTSVAHVPAFPVTGPIDIVGAGDSTAAALACAIASGASLTEAAAFGNLIASITIQQVGTTGTASPAQVRERWRERSRATDD